MDEDVKKQIARFRFGVIADLVGHRKLSRGERQRILQEKSQAQWDIPHSTRTRISRSTILHWLRRYEESGGRLESLYPDHRSDKDTSRALEAETAQALIRLKQEYRGATLPAVLREAKRRGVVPAQFRVSKATLYRFFKRQGLEEDPSPPVDRRRFEAELPNDIWQSDAMHAAKALVDGKLTPSGVPLLFQPGWRVRLPRVRRSVTRRDRKFFEDLANEGGLSRLPWPRKHLDEPPRLPEPVAEGLEMKPFIHDFHPGKLILLNTLSIFTQFLEKIKRIRGLTELSGIQSAFPDRNSGGDRILRNSRADMLVSSLKRKAA